MDKAAFLSKRAEEITHTVALPSGGEVTLRSLTIAQVKECNKRDNNEAALISTCMVQPAITYEEAVEWMTTAPMADYVAITDAALEMSGADEKAPGKSVRRAQKRRR